MKSLKKSIAKQEALTAQRVEKRKQAKEVRDTTEQHSLSNLLLLYNFSSFLTHPTLFPTGQEVRACEAEQAQV